ncbi:MAG: hypothetical protein JNK05_37800 [Myxococcales bacterium]|nr:hypothetical protein [Myxococcales bacterium]
MRRPPLALVFVAVTSSCAAHTQRTADALPQRLSPSNVAAVLRPGDFLFRYADPSDPVDGQVINALIHGGQTVAQTTFTAINTTTQTVRDILRMEQQRFTQSIASGDPNALHMAIYLGDGVTAEAFGTNLQDAKVNQWRLFAPYRARTAWRVLRHRDPRIAATVAEVARRWATGRMTYRVPVEVFVRDAAWGPNARSSALAFASSFETAGGPDTYSNMFCSQFAVAVLQSAAARHTIVANGTPLTPAAMDQLPREAKLDAVASPLRVYTEWSSSDAFEHVGRVVIEAPSPAP